MNRKLVRKPSRERKLEKRKQRRDQATCKASLRFAWCSAIMIILSLILTGVGVWEGRGKSYDWSWGNHTTWISLGIVAFLVALRLMDKAHAVVSEKK